MEPKRHFLSPLPSGQPPRPVRGTRSLPDWGWSHLPCTSVFTSEGKTATEGQHLREGRGLLSRKGIGTLLVSTGPSPVRTQVWMEWRGWKLV